MTALLEDRMADVAPARAANWLLFAVTGFVAVFMLWAAFAKLDVTVRGQGRVVPSSQGSILLAFKELTWSAARLPFPEKCVDFEFKIKF